MKNKQSDTQAMASPLESYSMGVGSSDSDRLSILNKYYNPGSKALLLRAGLTEGCRVAEIGCGQGTILKFIADKVGTRAGHIYGIDHSAEQLKMVADNLGLLPNVSLLCCQAADDFPFQKQSLDLIYCRLLLIHTENPLKVISHLLGYLKKGGKLVIEDTDATTLRYVPSLPGLDLWKGYWGRLGKALNVSYHVCDELFRMLAMQPVKVIDLHAHQPVSWEKEAKLLHLFGFQQLTPLYLEKGGATAAEITQVLAKLMQSVEDPLTYVELYKMLQFIAVKN